LLGRYPGADGMKTGFICASGFNLVATATRNGKQLIAVVLGSPSGGARAVKAAELLEGGFTQNPLSWLTPALGTVDNLTPINADPPNLHEQVCGSHRKRPAAEDEDADAGGETGGGVDTPFSALLSSLRAPTPKGAALLSDFGSITPTVVYTGPTRTPDQLARLSVEDDAPHHKKKGGKTAVAKPTGADETTTEGKTPEAKGAAAKTDDGKTRPVVHWTPTSSSSLATSPPPGLEAKPGTDKPKKKPQKADAAAAKPAAAPAQ
jgi:D-alanyl-D-alanine carboxypeptidase